MQSVLSWYRSGGQLMTPLLVIGALGVLLLIERFRHVVLRSRINPRPFMERVISLTRAGKVDEALELCAQHHSVIPDLGLVLLRSRSSDETELRAVADAARLTVTPSLNRRLRWLPMLARLSLLLGAFGAIVNLHDALDDGTVAALRHAVRPLGAAVLTALPLLAGHALLLDQVQATTEHLDEFAARLINALLKRPDVRLGHRE